MNKQTISDQVTSLDVYLDLGNIAGWLALPGLKALAEKTQVSLNWLPIRGIVPRPLSPEPKQKLDDRLADYKLLRWRAKHQFEMAELIRDCERMNLNLEVAKQSFESSVCHQACLFLSQRYSDKVQTFIEKVYVERFKVGRELTALPEVAQLIDSLGVDAREFGDELEFWQETWQTFEATYLALGIHDSPSFVLIEETFQGRQHFPLLEWRIMGESGPMPV